jgi:hypothetical protein
VEVVGNVVEGNLPPNLSAVVDVEAHGASTMICIQPENLELVLRGKNLGIP